MASPSPERGRSRTRSHTPTAAKAHSPVRDHSPRRSVSPRSVSHSRTPSRTPSHRGGARRNGFKGGRSRSRSPSRTPSRSRSAGRGGRNYRERSYTRSASRGSPVPRSSKVCQRLQSLELLNPNIFQIVVEKLTKNVNEDHLREIFGAYGTIRELELPMNKHCMFPWPPRRSTSSSS